MGGQVLAKWPIAHLTSTGDSAGSGTKLFMLDGDRIRPNFAVDGELGDVFFEPMVAELIEYRLASYVLHKDKSVSRTWLCRLAYADGHPVVRLDRRQHPDLPVGHQTLVADGTEYEASFAKGALAVANRPDVMGGNALPGLLRGLVRSVRRTSGYLSRCRDGAD